MPTITVKSIGSGGGRDYSTMQAWNDACPANLVSSDEIWQGEAYNDSTFTAAVDLGGGTSDATRYMYLKCATGQSIFDQSDIRTAALTYNTARGVTIESSGVPVRIFGVNIRVDGLQARRTSYSVGFQSFVSATSGLITRCISNNGISLKGSTTLVNSLVFGGGVNRCSFVGCTFAGGGTLTAEYGIGAVYYSLFVDTATSMAGLDNAYCPGSWAGGGSGNVGSLTASDQVESTSNDFRPKAGNSLQIVDYDVNWATDCTGTARGNPYMTAGFFEYVASVTDRGVSAFRRFRESGQLARLRRRQKSFPLSLIALCRDEEAA